ncbi:hypothetical protein S40293_11503 [Stachybotrys chartarum IBT 40293]|nr:hypothetical protein S40293_11503 [Stachybotrys chartarum IBT 40293]
MSRCTDTPPSSRFGRRDPQEDLLAGPSIHKSGYDSWAGRALIEHIPTHWGCILADRTAPVDQRPNRSPADKYLLRSELLACVSLLRLQINETLWDIWEQKFTGWELRVGDSPVKSTVVCFEDTRVRVIQVSYEFSSPTPSLIFTVQGSYALAAGPAAPCSKEAIWVILWWILNPDGPSDSLTSPTREEPNERQPRPRKKEHRVPSPNGSATSAESQPSSEGSLSSLLASVDASG